MVRYLLYRSYKQQRAILAIIYLLRLIEDPRGIIIIMLLPVAKTLSLLALSNTLSLSSSYLTPHLFFFMFISSRSYSHNIYIYMYSFSCMSLYSLIYSITDRLKQIIIRGCDKCCSFVTSSIFILYLYRRILIITFSFISVKI